MDKQTIYDTVIKYNTKEEIAKHAIDLTAKFVYADVQSLVINVMNLKLRSPNDVKRVWKEIQERWDGNNLVKEEIVKPEVTK